MNRLCRRILTSLSVISLLFPFATLALVPNDFLYSAQWYLETLRSPASWDISTGSSDVIVAVLDSGIDLNHPDLEDNLWKNENEIPGDNIDNDHNGFEDDYDGWDFVSGDENPSPEITEGFSDTIVSHGTLVAGLIGAVGNNGKGIAGILWDVKIMPLRILDTDGTGYTYDVRQAIRYAVENGADVVNLSFTTTQQDAQLLETIRWAYAQGVVIVTSVGNDNTDLLQSPVFPACYDLFQSENMVIGVGATDRADAKASFSNYGKGCVDISAPGIDILGTVYHDPDYLLLSTPYGGPWEGTSVAAPLVTGAVALMKAAYPTLTPEQIIRLLRLSADPVEEASALARQAMGNGRLDIANALDASRQLMEKGGGQVVTDGYLSSWLAFAQGTGSAPLVFEVTKDGEVLNSFFAYAESFLGGVRMTVTDTDGDEDAEIVTVPGPGGGPQVRVFDPDGRVLSQFFAFDEEDRSGLFVTTGDVNGDGVQEIIVSQDEGGTGQVRYFTKDGMLLGFFSPFDRTSESIHVAAGNLDEDATDELVVSKGGSEGMVRVYEGTGKYVSTLNDPMGLQTTERLVSVGDVDQDGVNDIVISFGQGTISHVFVHNAMGVFQQSFIAYPIDFLGGTQIVVGDLDQNGESEIYSVPTSNGGPHVRVFNKNGDAIGGFFVGDEASRFGGSLAL